GQLLASLSERYPRSTFIGYDRNPMAIRMARKLQLGHNRRNLQFKEGTAGSHGSMQGFSVVVANCVLLCEREPQAFLLQMHRVLAEDGHLLLRGIRSPREGSEQDRLAAFLHAHGCMIRIPQAIATGQADSGTIPHLTQYGFLLTRAGFAAGRMPESEGDPLAQWLVTRRVSSTEDMPASGGI